MKTTILLTVASLLTVISSASANEVRLAPRAQANADSLRRVSGSAGSADLTANRPSGNVRAWETSHSFRKSSGNTSDADLARGPQPLLSPRDPRYETVARELREKGFQVAPLK